MKKTLNIITAVCLLGMSMLANVGYACCSNTANAGVTTIYSLPSGQFFFSLNGSESNKPDCNTTNRFVFDSTTPGGKSMMSIVLAAYASGKTLTVVGMQTCTVWPDSEDIGALKAP